EPRRSLRVCRPAVPTARPVGSPDGHAASVRRTCAGAGRGRCPAAVATRTPRNDPCPPLSTLRNGNGPFGGPVPWGSRTRLRRERRTASTARLRIRVDEREATREPLLDGIERRAVQGHGAPPCAPHPDPL